MSREGVTENQLTRGEPSAELNNVMFEVASTAKVRLEVRVLEIMQAACGRASCDAIPLVSCLLVSIICYGADCARQVTSICYLL